MQRRARHSAVSQSKIDALALMTVEPVFNTVRLHELFDCASGSQMHRRELLPCPDDARRARAESNFLASGISLTAAAPGPHVHLQSSQYRAFLATENFCEIATTDRVGCFSCIAAVLPLRHAGAAPDAFNKGTKRVLRLCFDLSEANNEPNKTLSLSVCPSLSVAAHIWRDQHMTGWMYG